jgi:hypothetical protein
MVNKIKNKIQKNLYVLYNFYSFPLILIIMSFSSTTFCQKYKSFGYLCNKIQPLPSSTIVSSLTFSATQHTPSNPTAGLKRIHHFPPLVFNLLIFPYPLHLFPLCLISPSSLILFTFFPLFLSSGLH